jgi:hypothetical protein
LSEAYVLVVIVVVVVGGSGEPGDELDVDQDRW